MSVRNVILACCTTKAKACRRTTRRRQLGIARLPSKDLGRCTVQPWRVVRQRARRAAEPRAGGSLVSQGSRPRTRRCTIPTWLGVLSRPRRTAGLRSGGCLVVRLPSKGMPRHNSTSVPCTKMVKTYRSTTHRRQSGIERLPSKAITRAQFQLGVCYEERTRGSEELCEATRGLVSEARAGRCLAQNNLG